MDLTECRVRHHVISTLRDTAAAPGVAEIAAALEIPPAVVAGSLRSLASQHRVVLRPGSESIWMVHPFSGIATDYVVHAKGRRWHANCVWDGLAILGLVGDGRVETHSPHSGAPVRLDVDDGRVTGDAIVHFLVPARRFWDDIGFT
jgi:hypothetical protein